MTRRSGDIKRARARNIQEARALGRNMIARQVETVGPAVIRKLPQRRYGCAGELETIESRDRLPIGHGGVCAHLGVSRDYHAVIGIILRRRKQCRRIQVRDARHFDFTRDEICLSLRAETDKPGGHCRKNA